MANCNFLDGKNLHGSLLAFWRKQSCLKKNYSKGTLAIAKGHGHLYTVSFKKNSRVLTMALSTQISAGLQ